MQKLSLLNKEFAICDLPFILLDENFYSSIRREVNPERLRYLSEASRNLKLPSLFGKFSCDADYLSTVDLFIKATEETRNRGMFLLKKLLPYFPNFDTFLDVGPGNGKITSWIGRKFKEVTLIDPVPQVLENIQPKSYPSSTVLKKICRPFLETILPKNYFDFILLSHVIYHFPQEKWINAIESAMYALKPEGTLAVVINSGLDREKLGNNFNGKTHSIESFIHQLSRTNKKVEVFLSKESFYAKDLTTMLHICGLHLHDTNGKAPKEELEKYIESNFSLGNNSYKMEIYQYFIVIKNELTKNSY
ncbi:class I SAM-dependent methyltransferase [Candidatus Odyssella thessalonicensis]|uniref:class I SAM-dependent methyltransferase n=1 Tax=Candidatus Odyssella thessalonicensis TaxID=84647 RepID=UPI000225BFCD|nr:class I SAM-dependent methyltransferase [Candidatus Odyssella thessalonicensis]